MLIEIDEYNESIKKYECINENNKYECFISDNNHLNQVTYKIINRDLFNAFEIYKPIIYNLDILKDIIKDYYSDESDIYESVIKEIIELIDENASDYYFRHKKTAYYSDASKLKNKAYEYYEYIKSFSDAYSIYDLFSLFDEIKSIYLYEYRLYENNFYKLENKFSNFKLYELIEYVISEIESRLNMDLMNFKICLNISNIRIFNNDMLFLNSEFLNNEIYDSMIINDLYSSGLYDAYESGLLNIDYYDEIDEYEIYENSLIQMYNNKYNTDMKYINKYAIILSISDILKLNEILSESNKYTLFFKLDSNYMASLFENTNNTLDESFIYDYYDEFNEILRNEYYHDYYYEINSSEYISGFKGIKAYDIYELIKIILNQFKHYNLNNSFKFNPELYELY